MSRKNIVTHESGHYTPEYLDELFAGCKGGEPDDEGPSVAIMRDGRVYRRGKLLPVGLEPRKTLSQRQDHCIRREHRVQCRAGAGEESSDDDGEGSVEASPSFTASKGRHNGSLRAAKIASQVKGVTHNHRQDSITVDSGQRPLATSLLANRLEQIGAFAAARKLRACSAPKDEQGNNPPRCGHAACPRCQRRKAKRYRKRLEVRFQTLDPTLARFITCTVATDDLGWGLRTLNTALLRLRRRRVWVDSIVGGEFFIEPHPAREMAGVDWNVHAHLIAQLCKLDALDVPLLKETWTELLSELGAAGKLFVKRVTSLWGGGQ